MTVQDVVQTATQMLGGKLAPREAVTILSTLARDALPEARQLRHDDPAKADGYGELLTVISGELRARQQDSTEPKMVEAVTGHLSEVRRALEG